MPHEVGPYQEGYWEASRREWRPPEEYLTRALPFGFFKGGRLRGGYSLCTEGPFRYIIQLPADVRPAWEARIAGLDVVEINCVWLEAPLRKGWHSWFFWAALLLTVNEVKGDVILVGASAPKLADAYRAALRPVREYTGPVTVDGHPEEEEWVGLTPRPRWHAVGELVRRKLP